MPVQVTTIMLGVEDLDRSKKFYGEGLGCAIDQDYPNFVSFNLGAGSSSLALYQREAAAADAGVPSEGSGFRGVSFHYIVSSKRRPRSGDTPGTSATRMGICGRSLPDSRQSTKRAVRQSRRWVPENGDAA